MGQRTQLLVRTHFGNEETETMVKRHSAYHYQWGFGRVTPMFALKIISEFQTFRPTSSDDLNTAIDEFLFKMKKLASPDYDEDLIAECFQNMQPHELDTLFNTPSYKYFDNNNGFITLDLYYKKNKYDNFESENTKLCVYEADGKQITINQWCKNYREFTSKEWQTGYIQLMESYGVSFEKPFKA